MKIGIIKTSINNSYLIRVFIDPSKSEDLQEKIGLHFCNWLFHSRFANKEVKLLQD